MKQISAYEDLLALQIPSSAPPNLISYILPKIQHLKSQSPDLLLNLLHLFPLMRPFLLHIESEIRTISLRIFRYLTPLPNLIPALTSIHIEHFLVRSLELEGQGQERVEAFKLLRHWLELRPDLFPKCLANALVAISESESDEFKKLSIEALRILAISNPVVIVWSGGLRTLTNVLLDLNTPQALSENIVYSMCYLLNERESRKMLRSGSEILKILSVFTDNSPGMSDKDLEVQINLARKSLVLMFRSWAGLIFLASNGLQTVISTLVHPGKSLLKEGILDTLIEVLSVPVDLRCKHFDLMVNYLAILIQSLLHCGLFRALILLAVDTNVRIMQRARKVLKIVTIVGPELLPNAPICPVNLGINTQGKAAELVADMDSTCRIKSEKNEDNLISLAISFIITENPGVVNPPSSLLSGIYKKHINDNIDDTNFYSMIYKSQVTSKDQSKWDWDLIFELISGPLSLGTRLSDARTQKFLKYLLMFYTASKGTFTNLEWEPKHFLKARIGGMLIKFLISTKSKELLIKDFQESFFVIRKPFLDELVALIDEEIGISTNSEAKCLTPENLRNKMAREYLKWLGLFINTRAGRKLLRPFSINSKLERLSETGHIASVLLTVLDYREKTCQHFLNFCLQAKSKFIKLKALQQIQVIFRAGLQDLTWVIDELPSILYIQDPDIIKSVLNVINEICHNKVNLARLIETRPPNLLKLKDRSIYLKILTLGQGYDFLDELDLIDKELEHWNDAGNVEYGRDVESKIVQSLNSSKKLFALTLKTPKTFQTAGKLQLSWIANLPLIICLKFSDKVLEFDSVLEVFKEEIFISCYTNGISYSTDNYLAACLKLSGNFINFQGNFTLHPFWVMCKMDLKESKSDSKDSFENEGVIFSFSLSPKLILESIKFRLLVLPKGSSAVQPPRHFFGELSKTEKGFEKIVQRGLIEKYGKLLKGNSNIADKRGWLWALGHIGTSPQGSRSLIETNTVKTIVDIAELSETLSLRGTAFQVLSLLARTEIGKNELKRFGWLCTESVDSNIVAVPLDSSKFFYLNKELNLIYHQLCGKLEEVVDSVVLSEQEEVIYKHICRLGTVADKSESENYLRSVRVNQPKLFQSLNLFHIVSVTMAGYSFKLQTRRVIHKLLERVYRIDNYEELDKFKYVM